MVFVYVTCKDMEEARKISMYLIEKKLIACSNMLPINSMYEWHGKIEEEKEYLAILKTKKDRFENIKKEIGKIHSYDVPCICLIDSEENQEYAEYVDSVLE